MMRLTNSISPAQMAKTTASNNVDKTIARRVLWKQKLSTKKAANMSR